MALAGKVEDIPRYINLFLIVLLKENTTKEDMITYHAIMFRSFNHNKILYEGIIKHLEDNQSNSLTHIAIFLKAYAGLAVTLRSF